MQFKNTIKIASIEPFAVRATGGVSPNMAIGSMPTRPALLVRVTDSDGCYGWGEIWANFPPRANTHKAHIIEDVIAPKLASVSYIEPREIELHLRKSLSVYFLHVGQCQVFEHILAGLDMALWDLALRKADQSFKDFMNLSAPGAATYASSINIDDIDTLIKRHAGLGQRFFKIKVGLLEDNDRELVERTVKQLPAGTRFMIDSNQSWNINSAKKTLASLEPTQPFFAEEALPANAPLSEWEELANSTEIPLAGGENIYGIDQFIAMANAGLKVLQPDVAKWGGVTGALDLAATLPAGTLLWPHFMGTAVGQMAALSITAALAVSKTSANTDNSVCEVDVNNNPLRTELCSNALDIQNGKINLINNCGLVCEPTNSALRRFTDQ